MAYLKEGWGWPSQGSSLKYARGVVERDSLEALSAVLKEVRLTSRAFNILLREIARIKRMDSGCRRLWVWQTALRALSDARSGSHTLLPVDLSNALGDRYALAIP